MRRENAKDMVLANCGGLRRYAKEYAQKRRTIFSTMMDTNGISNATLANSITRYRVYAYKYANFKKESLTIDQEDMGYISLAVLEQICAIFETNADNYIIKPEEPATELETPDDKSIKFEEEIAKLNQLMQAQSNKSDAMLECMLQLLDYVKDMRDDWCDNVNPMLTEAGKGASRRKPIHYGYNKEANI